MQCKQCSEQFNITDSDRIFYSKMDVPEPTHCPDCRAQRRMGWRNERTLYPATCLLCKKSIISSIAANSGLKIYCRDCWKSDKNEGLADGRDFDFNRPFFEQFRELLETTPLYNLFITGTNENSDYINCAGFGKNCYMIFNGGLGENNYYCRGTYYSKDCAEMYFCLKDEKCSNDINCRDCYNTHFSRNSDQCIDCYFVRDCTGCSNCIGCTNLHSKNYCFFNEQLTKEGYEKRRKELELNTHIGLEKMKRKFEEFSLSQPYRANQLIKCEDSVGDYLKVCKNVTHCFEIEEGENLKYCDSIKFTKDAMDIFAWGAHSEFLYETVGTGESNTDAFTIGCEGCSKVYYAHGLDFCENCFGCVNLKHKKYCIFNKQYSEEDYKKLRAKIIEHMKKTGEYGEFFPLNISIHHYNETLAQDNYPLSKEAVLKQGWKWQDNLPGTFGQTTFTPEKISEDISQIDESITKEILECVECKKNYRIIKAELDFYKKADLPLPRRCFNCRYQEKIQLRGPRKLWKRTCMNKGCEKETETAFNPEGKEIVYCEACYKKAVY